MQYSVSDGKRPSTEKLGLHPRVTGSRVHAGKVYNTPITQNLKKQEAFAEGKEKGRKEGRSEGVQAGKKRVLFRLLDFRFGAIPFTYQERIADAVEAIVLLWSERMLSAEQLADVFAD